MSRGDAASPGRTPPSPRAGTLRLLLQWHWISSAVCLIGLLGFAVTGITLNHASRIEAEPRVVERQWQLPPGLAGSLRAADDDTDADRKAPLPAPVRAWLAAHLPRPVDATQAEWSADEIDLAAARPGGDTTVRIDRATGRVAVEDTDRGWLAYFNDLHKGRNAGPAWGWFLDAFAVSCLVFSLTGLLILKFHATRRPGTWPLVGLGLVIPALLALLLVH